MVNHKHDAFHDYLRTIARYPLLTAEEEIELSRKIKPWEAIAHLHFDKKGNAIADMPPHVKKMWRTAEQAKNKFIQSNLRLVVKVAKKYFDKIKNTSIEPLDLVQEGAMGLRRAAEKFDHEKGYKFSTYSFAWIRQAITRYIANNGRTIRLPIHLNEALGKIRKAYKDLGLHEDEPSFEAIAAHINLTAKPPNWTAEKVRFTLESSLNPRSLDAKRTHDHDADDLMTTVGVEGEAETLALEQDVRDAVKLALTYLNCRESEIIRCRYGIDIAQPMTLEEIGLCLGISRERVRQIERQAMNKMRRRKRTLSPELIAS